jgi:putative hydrolase of the HAD superfamily
VRTPSAVLLDLYDTLVWSEWSSIRDAFAERLGVSTDDLLGAFDRTRVLRGTGAYKSATGDAAVLVEALGMEADPALVAELTELERDRLVTAVHLHEESIPVLRELRGRGVRTALISNCSHATRPVVDRLGLEDEFDAVVLSFEVGSIKPEPAIYLTALDRLNAEPGDAVFVDDQAAYCDGAAAVGIQTRLIARDPAEAARSNGHVVIRDLRALLEDPK